MAFYVDEHIKNTERVFPDQGRYGMLRYDMNENPEGLPAWFVDEVKAEITPEYLSIYPEPDRFLTKYAKYVGVPRDCVTATNGTDQAIRYLLQTFCGQGHDVVTVAPSFEMYWVNCNILGLNHVPVAYNDDLSFNMENLIAAIGPNTDIVVLLNPNNPVGDAFSREDVIAAIEAARAVDAVVIIDEAYHYFYPNTFIDLTQTYDNVIVMRTFSKLFSLAACRPGRYHLEPDHHSLRRKRQAHLRCERSGAAVRREDPRSTPRLPRSSSLPSARAARGPSRLCRSRAMRPAPPRGTSSSSAPIVPHRRWRPTLRPGTS